MKMTSGVFWVTVIAVLIASAAITFFITKGIYGNTQITTINLTEEQTKKIIQDARKGYVPSDSVDALLVSLEQKAVKKTVTGFSHNNTSSASEPLLNGNITDLPVELVYEAEQEDSVTFVYEKEDYSAEITLALKPTFYPARNKFITNATMKSFSLTFNQKAQGEYSFFEKFGYGITASTGYDFINKTWYAGIGVGVFFDLSKSKK